jgi:hypothetical protein
VIEYPLGHGKISLVGVEVEAQFFGLRAPRWEVYLAEANVLWVWVAKEDGSRRVELAGFFIGVAPRFAGRDVFQKGILRPDLPRREVFTPCMGD